MSTAITVIHIIICIALAIVILAQPAKQAGLGAALGGSGGGDSDNFFSKNKGRTYEGKMEKLTIFLTILFVITTIGLSYVANL
ncbi:preprotein translocase subunit SecG [Clostridium cylindrosporum]|uniref:Protein-export membrane protein SecG n=1 Tax=Clostridium cylindrosporum DSM 605 TaxID=1121307 RepID=A0A0J8D942_CLOCY|nr:protein translocase, SecG subunit [Clostridium cylindrosporum DSM 605]